MIISKKPARIKSDMLHFLVSFYAWINNAFYQNHSIIGKLFLKVFYYVFTMFLNVFS